MNIPSLFDEASVILNQKINISHLTISSSEKIWWECKRGHLWEARVSHRVNGSGCPYCSGRLPTLETSLEAMNHNLSLEWHPIKNEKISPSSVKPNSGKKVWWLCSNGHEWQAVVSTRTKGAGCPFCSGNKVSTENSFAFEQPDLLKEWHWEKNKEIDPNTISPQSHRRSWWLCLKGHEWEAQIKSRTLGTGCPFCKSKRLTSDNNLKSINPELAKEWHPFRNGDLKPESVFPNSTKKVWWQCNEGHEWERKVAARNTGRGCPYCSNQIITPEKSLATINPILAAEWHPLKNLDLTPSDVSPNSIKKVWWQCKEGHEWENTVDARNGRGCPFCAGKKASKEYCLTYLFPNLVEEWDWEKNYHLTPDDVVPGSNKKIWWKCEKGHEWQAPVVTRTSGKRCPYCSNTLVSHDNNLQVINPSLAEEWNFERNKSLKPSDVLPNSTKMVWWKCSMGHEWQSKVFNRNTGSGCPYCASKLVCSDNSLKSLYPKIAAEWLYEKNGKQKPSTIVAGSSKKVWWKCNNGHEWEATVRNRVAGNGCPNCNLAGTSSVEYLYFKEFKKIFHDTEHRVKPIKNSKYEADIYIPNLRLVVEYDGEFWHRNKFEHDKKKNKRFNSENITVIRIRENRLIKITSVDQIYKYGDSKSAYSVMKNILLFIKENYKLTEIEIKNIDKYLANKQEKIEVNRTNKTKMLNELSIAYTHPKLAQQWNYNRNGDLKPEMFTHGSGVRVWWKCDKGHEWQSSISYRNRGRGCPICSGKRANINNCLETLLPLISKDWNYQKNGNLTPKDVTIGSSKKVWWKCCYCNFEWEQIIKNRTKLLSPCPNCKKNYEN